VKTNASHPVVGKFLNGRYKIVQVLNAGAFAQTYIAEDTWLIGNPQCVVKHLKPNGDHPKQLQVCKRLFTSEAEILKKLGKHDQIPQLLDSFEEHQGFYLVQELIIGESLVTELPISKNCKKRWSEIQCVELLQDVLGILEFVHSHGVVHCDLKPNNLIRRASDGKLVLIDFGVAYQIPSTQAKLRAIPIQFSIASVAIHGLGYIPAEQFSGQPYPCSDIYALGMIAIEALTGLNPMQLGIDSESGEVSWQQQVSVSNPMACVINHMVRYDFKERYQSATDVRVVLKNLAIKNQEQGVRKDELDNALIGESSSELKPLITPVDSESLNLSFYVRELAQSCLPKLPPIVSGVGAGMATSNALAISFGLYTLLSATPSNPGLDTLARAAQEYQAGNLEEAIALAQSVPLDSTAYQESLIAIQKWRQEWNTAATQYQAVEDAYNEGRWRDIFEEARKTPDVAAWQKKVEQFIEQVKPEIEAESETLLQKAYQLAAEKDFTGALALIRQIPPETATGAKIEPKLSEYTKKQQIRADSLLQEAYDLAAKRDFSGALKYLSQISDETPTYDKAQIKMVEYAQKQHFKEEVERQASLTRAVSESNLRFSEPFVRSSGEEMTLELNPGTQLTEVSPRSSFTAPSRR
jgi:serine/threonine protein kinase